jgi:hypothetical protein
MNERKELTRQYMETPKRGGIFLITNTSSGKVYLGSSTNLHGPINKHRFMLTLNGHLNAGLQSDYNRLGESHFTFEVVDSFKHRPEDPAFNLDDELCLLEEIWLEKYPEPQRRYNPGSKIRE